jgi:hypothetical protein
LYLDWCSRVRLITILTELPGIYRCCQCREGGSKETQCELLRGRKRKMSSFSLGVSRSDVDPARAPPEGVLKQYQDVRKASDVQAKVYIPRPAMNAAAGLPPAGTITAVVNVVKLSMSMNRHLNIISHDRSNSD